MDYVSKICKDAFFHARADLNNYCLRDILKEKNLFPVNLKTRK